MVRTIALLLAVAAAGCVPKPRTEAEPEVYAPAESDGRRLTRLQEKIAGGEERVRAHVAELEGHRSGLEDATALDSVVDGLRSIRDRLGRLRERVNDPAVRARGDALDEVEREVARLLSRADALRDEGRRLIARPGGPSRGAAPQ